MSPLSAALSGIQGAERQLEKSAARIAGSSTPGADVDLAQEMVSMEQAKVQTEASPRVGRMASETIGTLVDMFA